MPALRIQFENAYYHVTCRGNARQPIFSSDTTARLPRSAGRSVDIYQTNSRLCPDGQSLPPAGEDTPGNLQEFMRISTSLHGLAQPAAPRSDISTRPLPSFLIDGHYLKKSPLHSSQSRQDQEVTRPRCRNEEEALSPTLSTTRVSVSAGGDLYAGRRDLVYSRDTAGRRAMRGTWSTAFGFSRQPAGAGKGHGSSGMRALWMPSGAVSLRDADSRKSSGKVFGRPYLPERSSRPLCGRARSREALLRKGYRVGRGLLMEMLYRMRDEAAEIGRCWASTTAP